MYDIPEINSLEIIAVVTYFDCRTTLIMYTQFTPILDLDSLANTIRMIELWRMRRVGI
jgi:hypothetical protein